jgi:hypothetical protein
MKTMGVSLCERHRNVVIAVEEKSFLFYAKLD